MKLKRAIPYALLIGGLLFSQCKKAADTVQDVDQTAALRNVTVVYDSLVYQLGLPAGATTSGKSFQQLRKEDSVTYTNPENYSITLLANMHVDNKKANAADAKFDGMTINIVMSTLTATPIQTVAGAFTVLKNTSVPVVASDKINLKTHRLVGLYIFQQVVAGNDLVTTLSPILNYTVGGVSGTIPLPDIHQNIPTRADAQTKNFLKGLLDSGIFNQ